MALDSAGSTRSHEVSPPQRVTKANSGVAMTEEAVPIGEVESLDRNPSDGNPQRWRWTLIPAWLVSLIVHVALILFMAAFHIPQIGDAINGLVFEATTSDPIEDGMEEFSIDSAMEVASPEEFSDVVPPSSPVMESVPTDLNMEIAIDVTVPTLTGFEMPSLSMDSIAQITSSTSAMSAMDSRSKMAKQEMLNRFGGSADTEKAVAAALKWIAAHQLDDGSWTFAHSVACRNRNCPGNGTATNARNAATGLALMPFLGAGQTHLEGEYKDVVFKGLAYLLRNMRRGEGSMLSWYVSGSAEQSGAMYAHGIAAISICEAYGMTKDPSLYEAAQRSLDFIAYAQSQATGGWDYTPRGAVGDTSIVGWQLMAMKSGLMSGLQVPQVTIARADQFLKSVKVSDSEFAYRPTGFSGTLAMTACGYLCQMYMGLPKDDPGLQKAAERFVERGPQDDIYFNYYATQVMKQVGGKQWDDWNTKMKNYLLPQQEKTGHLAGSWHTPSSHSDPGGRLYITCMSTMILEVYYRYMPIYSEQTEDDVFRF